MNEGWTDSNTINFALLVATIIGVMVAILSAVDARRSRTEAGEHEEKALTAATTAAEAAEQAVAEHRRTADALTRQADLMEEARPTATWRIERLSSERWKATNTTNQDVDFVIAIGKPDGHLQMERHDHQDVGAGQAFYFQFGGGFTDPSSLNVQITWRTPDGERHDEWHTIP